jgi:hypothetical protein
MWWAWGQSAQPTPHPKTAPALARRACSRASSTQRLASGHMSASDVGSTTLEALQCFTHTTTRHATQRTHTAPAPRGRAVAQASTPRIQYFLTATRCVRALGNAAGSGGIASDKRPTPRNCVDAHMPCMQPRQQDAGTQAYVCICYGQMRAGGTAKCASQTTTRRATQRTHTHSCRTTGASSGPGLDATHQTM